MKKHKNSRLICVKVAQRKLTRQNFRDKMPVMNYFPFDRVYLTRTEDSGVFKRLFRYYLSMPLTAELLDGLQHLRVEQRSEIPVSRDDARAKPVKMNKQDVFKTLITDHKGWILVVPTHVKSLYRAHKDTKDKIPYASAVAYVLSGAITGENNKGVPLPKITLHTPRKKIPALCALCKNQAAYMSADCTPGESSCTNGNEIQVELDTFHKNIKEKTIKATGGAE